MDDKKPTEVLTYKEILTDKLNEWRVALTDRMLKYHEAMQRMKEDPAEVIETSNGPMTLPAIIETRVQPLKEARAHVIVLEEMLKEEEAGNLANRWSDEEVKMPSPIAPVAGTEG